METKNGTMKLLEVKDPATIQAFLQLPVSIFKDYSNWVQPLDLMIENVFDAQKNSFHSHGSCIRWILQNEEGKTIGRVAAFINHKKTGTKENPTGGIGFFECINHAEAAYTLFEACKNWLSQRGMSSMLGNINFGENDNWWGLLIDGFDQKPSFGMHYHPPYYQELFRNYGFVTEYEQITNRINVYDPFPDRFEKIAQWVMKKPGYSFEHFSWKNLNKYAQDFLEIYNNGWIDFEHFTPLTKETVLERLAELKPIMDEKLIWFAYCNGEPASMVVVIPDANEFIYNINGKLNWLGKLKFAWNQRKGSHRMRAIIMGTKKKYQKHGLESCLFIKLQEYVYPLKKYNEMELSWVGDFNEEMISIHKATGAVFSKKHVTLRKNF